MRIFFLGLLTVKKFLIQKITGYGLTRIYGFLAERFLSYWFNKNYSVQELPIIVKDLSDYKVS